MNCKIKNPIIIGNADFAYVSHSFCPLYIALGGVIKQAPEDFVVWERRLDGSLVRPPGRQQRQQYKATPQPNDATMAPPINGRRWAGKGGDSNQEIEDDIDTEADGAEEGIPSYSPQEGAPQGNRQAI